MTIGISTSSTSTASLGQLDIGSEAVKAKSSKPISSAAFIDQSIRGQVVSRASAQMATPEQLERLLDSSTFSEAELATVLRINAEQGGENISTLRFDPSAWEQHGAVLIAAIIAMNISRQMSARLRGDFSILAAQAAQRQGQSIIDAGKAEMHSALTGAVVAGAMVIGGLGLQLKGMRQKHLDIKSNQGDAMNARNRAKDLDINLQKNSFKDLPNDPVSKLKVDQGGKRVDLKLRDSEATLTADERAKLSGEIQELNKAAEKSSWQSALNEKTWARNLNVGQALSTMGMVTSTMVASLIRLDVFSQRNEEVLEQTTQMLGKGVSDEEAQRTSESSAMLQKLMEVFAQIMQSRNAAASTIAGNLRA